MPMFQVRIKASMKIRDELVTANDMDDAQKQIMAKFPAAEIVSLRERISGYEAQTKGNAPVKQKSGLVKLVKLIIAVAILIAIITAAYKMGLMEKIGL